MRNALPYFKYWKEDGSHQSPQSQIFFSSCLQSPASVHFSQQQKEWITAFVMSSVHFISILYVMLCNKVAKKVNTMLISSLAFLSLSIFTYLIKSIEQIWHVFSKIASSLIHFNLLTNRNIFWIWRSITKTIGRR